MKKNNGSSTLPASPYIVWSTLFIVIPLIIIVFFSFTQETASGYSFTLENFKRVLNSQYISVFKRSLILAFESTVLCLILGYPVAYFISKMKSNKRNVINNFLSAIGLNTINILYTDAAVLLGMVYNFLPFMILPIYTVLIKMDNSLIDAAADLGANKRQIFTKVIFPLSMPGVITGITMVFMPAVSTFVISRLLGGGQYMLLGNLIETQFTTMGDWNFGSALAIFMMIIILISMAIMNKFEGTESMEGGK